MVDRCPINQAGHGFALNRNVQGNIRGDISQRSSRTSKKLRTKVRSVALRAPPASQRLQALRRLAHFVEKRHADLMADAVAAAFESGRDRYLLPAISL